MRKRKLKLIIVLVLMSLIPVAYSSLFLGALMDPYGRVTDLPVAVVTSKDNVILDSMKKHKLFKLTLENQQQADKDLQRGRVYGIVKFDDDVNQAIQQYPMSQISPQVTLISSEGLSYTTSKLLKNTLVQFIADYNQKVSQGMITNLQGQNVPRNIGQVIHLKNIERHPVKNNGTAMAPYIFSLTLFVGGIFVNQFVMRVFSRKQSQFKTYWLTEFMIPFAIASLQVAILLIVNHFFIKIEADQGLLLIPFALLVAATFSSIIVAFNKLIPGVGSLIVLLLTMLQTSSSGGTYAINLSSSFFQAINSFLPMTYSIDGFKKLISLNNTAIWADTIILLGFFILGQLILFRAYQKHKMTPIS